MKLLNPKVLNTIAQLKSGLIIILLLKWYSSDVISQTAIDPSHYVPLQKNLSQQWNESLMQDERKFHKGKELLTIGMPCRGIAAGHLYVSVDGILANWLIANDPYNKGYSISQLLNFNATLVPWKVCYQTFCHIGGINQIKNPYIVRKSKITLPC